ncbi:LysR family transcriptional regulator [Sporomusa malonica]|uniref:DNA-binding transcriptional regulator, LysR family n=1 Tax=Sporomusa malonica TaxID=112901 RepID=A0A1W2ESK7_9FIRM|nr:LysR family transcriptional regulator [Sporomusa malonica]SMD12625.1 DNA-binding transcriptional regulator, LysR family [Sporomusa malonica]
MDINFELYKVFYHVAKTLSFSEASSQLHISQSAVSQSIRLLEDRINSRLFSRTTKQVKLTPEGTMLFSFIEQAYQFIKTGERNLQDIHSLTRGELRIAASDTLCRYYLLPYLKQFNKQYPHIKINITNRTSPVCTELVRKGLVDISFVNLLHESPIHQRERDTKLTITKLNIIQDVFVAGKDYRKLQQLTLSLKDLENYPILVLEKNTVTRSYFDAILKSYDIFITPEIELGSIDLLIDLAYIGLGIAFVPKEYIAAHLESEHLFLLTLKEAIPPRYLGAITNSTVPLPVAAQKFINLITDTL